MPTHHLLAACHHFLRFARRSASVAPVARCCVAALAIAACQSPRIAPARVAADSLALRSDIAYLASDSLEGRGTGTDGNRAAARYIEQRFRALNLHPVALSDAVACSDRQASADTVRPRGETPAEDGRTALSRADACKLDFLQRFSPSSRVRAHSTPTNPSGTQNVVALLRGTDRLLRGEYIVIGAHFDHLGRSTFGALDPGAGNAIRNGADDNASGTAAVMEMARILSLRPLRRSVIFAAFSGEELGLLGSQFFVEHPPVPLDKIVAMLNFDMVGRLRDDKLIVYGTGTAEELPAILDSANLQALKIRSVPGGAGPSDHSSFYSRGIPVLHFFTDLHDDYHRATDDVERINAGGLARVVEYAERVVRRIALLPVRLTLVRLAAPTRIAGTSSDARPYLGTVPDMAAADGRGLRISGVTPGSPGDKAGLRAGDIIVELDGKAVTDLETYAAALYARKAGDTVQIVVVRGDDRVKVSATLGVRSRN